MDDTYLLQRVQRWLHLRDCSGSESVITLLRLQTWFFGGTLNPSSNLSRIVGKWYDSNWFDLTPHDELVASFFRWLAQALGYVAWNIWTILNQKRYFGIQVKRWIQSDIYLGGKGRRGCRELEKKGVIDLGLSINKKIIKERVGQDTKIADFVLHLQLRKCKWNKGSGEKDELSRFIEKGK